MNKSLLLLSALILSLAIVAGGCARTPPTLPRSVAKMAADHPHPSFAERMEATVRAMEEKHGCLFGVSFKDKHTDLAFSYRGDELFHAASTMKVPVMIEVFRQIDNGNFRLQDTIAVSTKFRSMIDGSPFETSPRDGVAEYVGQRASLLFLTEQMIVVSDNVATNLLIELLRPQRITATMRKLGVEDGYVLRSLMDNEAFRAGISNRMTPNGLTRLMEAIDRDEAASPEACAEMRRILLDQRFRNLIPANLPEEARVAHKTGSIGGVRNDTGIVYAPFGTYYITILSAEVSDAQAAVASIAELSRLIYDERAALAEQEGKIVARSE